MSSSPDASPLLSADNAPVTEDFHLPCCLWFIQTLVGIPSIVKTPWHPPPRREVPSGRMVLVLDLDETLVHCSFFRQSYFHHQLQVEAPGTVYNVYVQTRPGLAEFLEAVSAMFVVFIFTSSLPQYANPVIDLIMPELPKERRLFRDACSNCDGLYVKDLNLFGTTMEQIVIIDNSPCSFLLQPANALLSKTWDGDKRDRELIDGFLPILRLCSACTDVRDVITSVHRRY